MAAEQHQKPASAHTSRWHPDARERLRAFLPELPVCVVAATGIASVLAYTEGTDTIALVAAVAVVQVVLQAALYTCTYLARDARAPFIPLLLLTMTIPVDTLVLATLAPAVSFSSAHYTILLSIVAGTAVFYLMRPRAGLVVLLIDMLALSEAVDEIPQVWVAHAVGFAAVTILLIMRSAPAHITRNFAAEGEPAPADEDAQEDARTPSIYVQVAATGAALGALCLAIALAGTVALAPPAALGSDAETPVEAHPEEQPTPAEGGTSARTQDEDAGSGASARPADGDLMQEPPQGASHRAPVLALLLLAALVLLSASRLLMRLWARFALRHEPQAADRVGKLYQAIVRRLAAAGIERNEAETPLAFLAAHEEELEELTGPAGIDRSAWLRLTEAYETARYAGLEPTDDELATCWQIYDALPGCVRRAFGWRHYLGGPFWLM